jgi:hypothetical protein
VERIVRYRDGPVEIRLIHHGEKWAAAVTLTEVDTMQPSMVRIPKPIWPQWKQGA